MKNIAILGSTGSIGLSALEVIRNFPDRFRVVGLSTNADISTLEKQIKEFRPIFVCVKDACAAKRLEKGLAKDVRLFSEDAGLSAMLAEKKIEKVLLAICGSAALAPLLRAIDTGKEIALANKEALVMAGGLIMKEAQKKKAKIIPVDSEQSAIWQCLETGDPLKLKNIYLTASGGPFFKAGRQERLKDISIEQVLRHPRWRMGRKISVDSANLMNKGLELLEAMFLFGLPCEKIKVIIHPQAIIHSMVEFIDGVVLAQLSATDMRIPIQYALLYPDRLANEFPPIDFYKLKRLEFYEPDFKRFPALRLAYRAAKELGSLPAVLNAANEISVAEFLKGRLKFVCIPQVIENVIGRHRNNTDVDLEDILEADAWARREAYRFIEAQ